jgi:hypothetical protein
VLGRFRGFGELLLALSSVSEEGKRGRFYRRAMSEGSKDFKGQTLRGGTTKTGTWIHRTRQKDEQTSTRRKEMLVFAARSSSPLRLSDLFNGQSLQPCRRDEQFFSQDLQFWSGLVLPGRRRSIQNRQQGALIYAKGWVADHLIFIGAYCYSRTMTVITRCMTVQNRGESVPSFASPFEPRTQNPYPTSSRIYAP